jgi:hypothetical protein
VAEIERIEAGAARRRVAEHNALLVCAYEDDERCRAMRLDGGAVTMSEFRAMARELPRDQEIIFYCA